MSKLPVGCVKLKKETSYFITFITYRKRSLRRSCFYRCWSVGGGGMHGEKWVYVVYEVKVLHEKFTSHWVWDGGKIDHPKSEGSSVIPEIGIQGVLVSD